MKRRNKRGEILVENVIFIVLNLVFISILAIFLINQSSGVVLLEQPYAKQLALLADGARPGMKIYLDMTSAKKISEKKGIPFENVISVDGNAVYVKLSEHSGKGYTFFNDIKLNAYPQESLQGEERYTGLYVLVFSHQNSVLEDSNEV